MSTAEQLQALTEKLAALEAQLKAQPGTEAAGPSGTAPGQITVKVPRERKLCKFVGSRDDHLIEDWILDADRAITGMSHTEAVDFLLYHLDGAAKEEVRLRPPEERTSSADVYKILRNSFGEGLTPYQAMQKFYERHQRERETIQEYSQALMVLLSRVERLAPESVGDRDQLLRDQFTGNLYDLQLRRDIKRWQREHPTRTFQQVREEVQRWVDEDSRPPRRSAVAREAAVEDPPDQAVSCEVKETASLQKVVNDLVAGQKLLVDSLQKQQKLLADHIRNQQAVLDRQQNAIQSLMSSNQNWWQPGCYGCGSKQHLQRDCPSNQRRSWGGGGKKSAPNTKPPALNEKAPRQ